MIYFKQTGEYFSDIYTAKEAVLNFAKNAEPKKRISAELILDPGEYVLERPLTLDTEEENELWRTAVSIVCENGRAVFTSKKVLECGAFEEKYGYYAYRLKKDGDGKYPRLRDLYADGKRVPICRSTSFIHKFSFSEENKRDNAENLEGFYIPEEAAKLIPEGNFASMELTVYVEWEYFTMHVVGIDRTRIKLDENGERHVLLKIKSDEFYKYVTGMNGHLKPLNREFFFANHPCLLTENTWCYDYANGVIYYRPTDKMPDELAVATLEKLLCFGGLDGVRLANIDFTCVTDKFTCENGYLSHQANVEKRINNKICEAAVFGRDVRRVKFENCAFYELGVNGILMLGELAMIYVFGSRFENIAMSAISIGNPTRASREKRNCSFDIRIENNYLRRIAYGFPTAPAINIFRVDGLSILNNTIEYCAYSGVSVGWEWGLTRYALGEMINIRDAEIAYNRISHHMDVLKDGGAIYVVGANCIRANERFFNFMHDNFAYRNSVKRTVRGYYLDGSSSNWHVYDNVVSGAQRPAFAQFIVPDQYTHNNLVERTYTTDRMDPENHCPERNTIFKDTYTEPSLGELFMKYPQARRIYESTGCKKN